MGWVSPLLSLGRLVRDSFVISSNDLLATVDFDDYIRQPGTSIRYPTICRPLALARLGRLVGVSHCPGGGALMRIPHPPKLRKHIFRSSFSGSHVSLCTRHHGPAQLCVVVS